MGAVTRGVSLGTGQQGRATSSCVLSCSSLLAVQMFRVPPHLGDSGGGEVATSARQIGLCSPWAHVPGAGGQEGKAPRSRPLEGLARSLLRSSLGWGVVHY